MHWNCFTSSWYTHIFNMYMRCHRYHNFSSSSIIWSSTLVRRRRITSPWTWCVRGLEQPEEEMAHARTRSLSLSWSDWHQWRPPPDGQYAVCWRDGLMSDSSACLKELILELPWSWPCLSSSGVWNQVILLMRITSLIFNV